MLSFSIKGMQINRICIFLINWKTYIINDYSKWIMTVLVKWLIDVSKVCLPQLFTIILKHQKRTNIITLYFVITLIHLPTILFLKQKMLNAWKKKTTSNSNQKLFLLWQVYCKVLGNTGGESARAETMTNYIAHCQQCYLRRTAN